MTPGEKTYLGDSIYAQIVDGNLALTTENGKLNDPSNEIYLDKDIWAWLVKYVHDSREVF